MFGILAKAAIYRPSQNLDSAIVLPQSISSQRHSISAEHYENYRQLVQWPDYAASLMHPNYIQVLTFPMQLNMMTSSPFPFKALGLVHIANKINVFNSAVAKTELELKTYFGQHFVHRGGIVFELHSEASQNGIVTVKATSYYMARTKTSGFETAPRFDENALLTNSDDKQNYGAPEAIAELNFLADSGRRYAKASGDYNPIHLWSATSRWFGFSKAIAHGMYSHALCISKLQANKHCNFAENCSIRAIFKQPISLPNRTTLGLISSETKNNLGFALAPSGQKALSKKHRLHIQGMVTPIQ